MLLWQDPVEEVANSSSGDVSTWHGQETSLCGSEAECRVLREEINRPGLSEEKDAQVWGLR